MISRENLSRAPHLLRQQRAAPGDQEFQRSLRKLTDANADVASIMQLTEQAEARELSRNAPDLQPTIMQRGSAPTKA